MSIWSGVSYSWSRACGACYIGLTGHSLLQHLEALESVRGVENEELACQIRYIASLQSYIALTLEMLFS